MASLSERVAAAKTTESATFTGARSEAVQELRGRLHFKVVEELGPSAADAFALVCGPPIMLKYTMKPLLDLGFSPDRIITSLERRMSCGIGKCGRCNIGGDYVCKDGPVFTYGHIRELSQDWG